MAGITILISTLAQRGISGVKLLFSVDNSQAWKWSVTTPHGRAAAAGVCLSPARFLAVVSLRGGRTGTHRTVRSWIPPPVAMPLARENSHVLGGSPWLAVRMQSPLAPWLRHCPLCHALQHGETLPGPQHREGLVTPGAVGTLSPLPKTGRWEGPCVHARAAPAKTAHGPHGRDWQSSPDWLGALAGPAPTTGLGDGSGRGRSPTAPSLLLPGGRSPSPRTHTSGRAQPSLPGWVTVASPCGHQEWATGTLAGQCPATVLGSFALGSPWPPPSHHGFEWEGYAGLCRHHLQAGRGVEESPGTLASSCSKCRGHYGAGTDLSW